jgi:hypothetical protein
VTEAEWLAAIEPYRVMEGLHPTLLASGYDRKARLFCCACVRRVFHRLPDPRSRLAVEVLELYVDGMAEWEEVERTRRGAAQVGGGNDAAACLGSEEPVIVAFKAMFHSAGNQLDREGYAREERQQCHLLRDIFGNPFRPVAVDPAWLTSDVLALAQGIYDERAFDRMPILADALQDAGCDNDDILNHCRGPGPHVRGCWVVDLLLGKS